MMTPKMLEVARAVMRDSRVAADKCGASNKEAVAGTLLAVVQMGLAVGLNRADLILGLEGLLEQADDIRKRLELEERPS